jgi:3-phenylpropionate/trans-cinnamate dioxygenase ferredoxin reductase subunit
MSARVVIVGAGQAGFQVAASLRADGFDGSIASIGEERHVPYQRPPLSKTVLAGKHPIESVSFRPERFYQDQRIDLALGERVVAIDRTHRHVVLSNGSRVDYDALVLATGARVRTVPTDSLPGVLYLRDRDHAVELKQRMDASGGIVVIGGGFIGLEVAAAARGLGKNVSVIEAQPRLMPRCVAPVLSEFYREAHTAMGVRVVLDRMVSKIGEHEVTLNDGTTLPADLVVAGIGVTPNIELARDAGLPVGDGILVDHRLRTGDENIFAIGDCSDHPNQYAGGRARIESVQNAADQAKCVAAQMVGKIAAYSAVPWFWTDQFDLKLQMCGLSNRADQVVVRGSLESRKFSVFYFAGARLIAVDSMNRPGDHMIGRKLLAAGTAVTPEQAGNESVDLKALIAG